MQDSYLIDLLIGLIALSIWLNWKVGYIQKIIDSILKQASLQVSLISFSILISPLCIHWLTNFISERNSLQKLLPILAPASLAVALAKDYVDRTRIRNALYSEFLLNCNNLYNLIYAYYLSDNKCSSPNLHRSLENQWRSTIYDKYIDQLTSGSIIDEESIAHWTNLYNQMRVAINSIDKGETFFNDEFLFEIFLRDAKIGPLSDIKAIMGCIDRDRINRILPDNVYKALTETE